jgi:hypothetical protein
MPNGASNSSGSTPKSRSTSGNAINGPTRTSPVVTRPRLPGGFVGVSTGRRGLMQIN